MLTISGRRGGVVEVYRSDDDYRPGLVTISGDGGGWTWFSRIVSTFAEHLDDFFIEHFDPGEWGGPLAPGSMRLDFLRYSVGFPVVADRSPFVHIWGDCDSVQVTSDDKGIAALAHSCRPPPMGPDDLRHLEERVAALLHPTSSRLRLVWV